MFSSLRICFLKDQIQNLTATTKVEGFFSNHCSPEFSAAFLQVPLEKELLLLLCLLYCLAPGRSNRKLSTYSLSLQLNFCLWYAKYRACHRNEKKNCLLSLQLNSSPICKTQGMSQKWKKIVYMWIRIESLSKFTEQFTDESTKICMLNL